MTEGYRLLDHGSVFLPAVLSEVFFLVHHFFEAVVGCVDFIFAAFVQYIVSAVADKDVFLAGSSTRWFGRAAVLLKLDSGGELLPGGYLR